MGTLTTDTPPLTAEEFEARYGGDAHKRTELVRGEVREMTPASGTHGRLCKRLLVLVSNHVDAHALGDCCDGQTGFRLTIPGRDDETVLSPDVGFIRAERLEAIGATGFVPFAPDLAVEIVSPSESAARIAEKLAEYLAAGTRAVWVVYPGERSVAVHAAGAAPRYLRERDMLDGGAVLPGFTVPVADLFRGLPGR